MTKDSPPSNSTPTTEIELEQWMKDNCFNFDGYSIHGNHIHEGCGIDRADGLFIWYFTERGEKRTLKTFHTEAEIIAHAYQEIKSDLWAKTHGVGFTEDKSKIEELAHILTEMHIEYIQDSIPYYAADRPMYRIFVLGCDIQQVLHLKEKYSFNPLDTKQ